MTLEFGDGGDSDFSQDGRHGMVGSLLYFGRFQHAFGQDRDRIGLELVV